jgi:catechol 2,3-dioxygenase-like lactoylglutathione lyase family enzyme
MTGRIALITVLADDVPTMVQFYRDVLAFQVANDLGHYVEFAHEGVRFAICARSIMARTTQHPSFKLPANGQAFELAFPLDTPEALDRVYAAVVAGGATPVAAPAVMPWGQKTAFFADPEGNIHELFVDLPGENIE